MTDRLFNQGIYIDPLTGQPTLTPPKRQPLPIQPGTPAANLAIPSTGQIQNRIPTARDRLRTALSTADPMMQATFGKDTGDIASALEFSPVGIATAAYDLPQQARELAREPSGRTALAAGLTAASVIPAFRGINRLAGAAAREAPSTARMFLGKGSKTADLGMLRQAQELEAAGTPAGDIWRETGWGRNAGGQWNYRISDIESRFDPEPEIQRRIKTKITNINKRRVGNMQLPLEAAQDKMVEADVRRRGFTTKLHKVFKHPELMKSEPELFKAQKFTVEPESKRSTYLAYANPAKKEIGLSHRAFRDPEEARSSILHELDHTVAEASGFPVGSSPTMYAKGIDRSEKAAIALATREKINSFPGATWEEKVQAQADQYDAALGRPGAFRDKIANNADVWKLVNRHDIPDARLRAGAKLYMSNKQELDAAKQLGMEDVVRRDIAFKSYQKTAGEAAARNTQATRDFTAEELQLMPPMESTKDLIGREYGYDVPLDQQLVIDEAAIKHSNLPEIYSPEEWQARGGGPSSGAGGPRYLTEETPPFPTPKVRRPGPGLEPTRPLDPENLFFEFGPLVREGAATRGQTLQAPIERYRGRTPSGTTPRGELLLDRGMVNKMVPLVEKGIERGGLYWHDTEPIRRATQKILGQSRGHENFMENMDIQGRASPMSDVLTNIRNASHYRWLLDQYRKGNIENLPVPYQIGGKGNWHASLENMHKPYIMPATWLHQDNMQNLIQGIPWNIKNRPKPPSYGGNLQGNRVPWAGDTHAMRAAGQKTRSPLWLTNEARRAGKTPETASPTDWEAKPGDAEYWALEELGHRTARRMGIQPMHTQASQWVGGAELTGLVTDYNKSFPDLYSDVVKRTMADPLWPELAKRVGVNPNMSLEQLWRSHVKDYTPLLAIPPALMAAGAGGQDEQRVNPFFEIY